MNLNRPSEPEQQAQWTTTDPMEPKTDPMKFTTTDPKKLTNIKWTATNIMQLTTFRVKYKLQQTQWTTTDPIKLNKPTELHQQTQWNLYQKIQWNLQQKTQWNLQQQTLNYNRCTNPVKLIPTHSVTQAQQQVQWATTDLMNYNNNRSQEQTQLTDRANETSNKGSDMTDTVMCQQQWNFNLLTQFQWWHYNS